MSRLVARILLTIFMLPATAVVYILAFVCCERRLAHDDTTLFLWAGAASWTFVAVYWLLLWRSAVAWTQSRIALTAGSVLISLAAGAVVGIVAEGLISYSHGSFGCFIGSMVAEVLWLILTVFAWRETPAERRERLRSVSTTALVCPHCGYNLTGLTTPRCPECGTQFTIDELIASQPQKVEAEIET